MTALCLPEPERVKPLACGVLNVEWDAANGPDFENLTTPLIPRSDCSALEVVVACYQEVVREGRRLTEARRDNRG